MEKAKKIARKGRKLPTAKQLAARRKFIAMVRSGKFRKAGKRTTAKGSRRGAGGRTKKASSPSPAQIRARKRFAAMAKARAKAARGRRKNSVGGFIKRVLGGGKARVGARKTQRGRRKVAATGTRRTQRGKAKAGAFSVVKRGGYRPRTINPKRGFNTFRGRPVRQQFTTFAANGTPRDLKECGKMVDLKMAGGKTIRFNGNSARLCHKGNRLYITGARFRRPNPPSEVDYGEIARICYHADKPHLEGDNKARPYEHKFGEDGGVRPRLIIDEEGLPIISGGSYRVTPDGIVD